MKFLVKRCIFKLLRDLWRGSEAIYPESPLSTSALLPTQESEVEDVVDDGYSSLVRVVRTVVSMARRSLDCESKFLLMDLISSKPTYPPDSRATHDHEVAEGCIRYPSSSLTAIYTFGGDIRVRAQPNHGKGDPAFYYFVTIRYLSFSPYRHVSEDASAPSSPRRCLLASTYT